MPQDIQWFEQRLFRWFGKNHRDLPWRKTRDPYKILVSEIMLQQTQVDRVIPKYRAFLRAFPTVRALASSPTSAVIRAWSGLGYNRRALYLKRAAEGMVCEPISGILRRPVVIPSLSRDLIRRRPRSFGAAQDDRKGVIQYFQKLPGVGKYTARAISAFAFEQDVSAVDTNVGRVLLRVFFGIRPQARRPSASHLQAFAQAIVPKGKGWMWNHAMMDFGALVCTKKKPKCQTCPMRQRCRAYPAALIMSSLRGDIRKRKQAQPFVGSTRYWRGRIVDALRNASESGLSKGQLQRIFHGALDRIRLEHILSGLRQDKLVVYRGSLVKFPR